MFFSAANEVIPVCLATCSIAGAKIRNAQLNKVPFMLILGDKELEEKKVAVREKVTGDLGAMAARKFDVEVWMAGRDDYGEVTSTSNCTDYQARNLNIKYKKKNGETEYLHMLNGTAIVMSRVPVAILENFQNEDGSVNIPTVLQKWMGKDKIEVRK